ncbi:diaminopimelate epimerase [Nocardioides phosphati]|uniref:Diaminopimelate epimerase n=1 Tax=Nocardioides phosphati TaxID=1867775 RepID=A0ABQ2N6F3_9ACTN|nr:diaminopimelate epimerase [Nocardioides phosphati]GGO84083.1 diaminopimelate epimerase [Nocardioides phosphati]
MSGYRFLKGHGTENDFVLLPDHDGTIHGALAPERVAALCDRRAGIGADGVVRVIRTAALAEHDPSVAGPITGDEPPEWFMDYRNGDGSVAEMCGNATRVFARHLLDEGLVPADQPVRIATRAGVKTVTRDGDTFTTDMGTPTLGPSSTVTVGHQGWPATNVDMGNPHAVAFLDDLAEAGRLLEEPGYDPAVYPQGVNIEFVTRVAERHVAMRVHERGAGETRSCGTGACAVLVATAIADGARSGARPASEPVTYRVDVPGGELTLTWTPDDHVLLAGPAAIVAEGTTDL